MIMMLTVSDILMTEVIHVVQVYVNILYRLGIMSVLLFLYNRIHHMSSPLDDMPRSPSRSRSRTRSRSPVKRVERSKTPDDREVSFRLFEVPATSADVVLALAISDSSLCDQG